MLPLLGAIRIGTVITAIAIAAAVWWRRRSALLAIVTVMAWAAAFEIAFNAIGTAVHGWSVGYLLWLALALAGWVVLAVVRGVVPDWRLGLAAAVLALAWIFTAGFAVNTPGRTFSPLAEVFNEGTKVLLGVGYLIGGLRAR